MNLAFKTLRNLLAGMACVASQILYFKKLKISFPSISLTVLPFEFHKGSTAKIGRRATIGRHCGIIVKGHITIGNNLSMNKYSRIVSHKNITIGDNVTIAQFVSILDHDHGYKMVDGNMVLDGYSYGAISIGNNVWIGDKVTICKGVTIGNNVIIGANSVVTRDIENNCIAVGNPCRRIKTL